MCVCAEQQQDILGRMEPVGCISMRTHGGNDAHRGLFVFHDGMKRTHSHCCMFLSLLLLLSTELYLVITRIFARVLKMALCLIDFQ